MTQNDERMALFLKMAAEKGQAQAARELGYSASAVNQVIKGTYKGELNSFLQRVAEVYGAETVNCPVLGEMPLGRCAEEKKTPFSASSPLRVRMFKACRECRGQTTPACGHPSLSRRGVKDVGAGLKPAPAKSKNKEV